MSRSGANYVPFVPGVDEGSLFIPNHWYPAHNAASLAGSPANGVIHTYAMPVQVAHTFTNIGINVTIGSTGGLVDLGIYADNGAGYPGALLFHTGAVVATTSVGATTAALVAALGLGLFHLAVDYSASSVAPTVTFDNGPYAAFLGSSVPGNTGPYRGYILTAQPATLPASFPGGGSQGQVTIISLQA